MKRIRHPIRAAAVVLPLWAFAALAHHSDAGIDQTKTVSVKGTLKQFAWSAPHAQIIVVYQDDKGQSVELGVSTFAPGLLLKQGFTPKDFRRGDQVEVFYHPTRSGAPGGILVKFVGQDGRVLSGEQLSLPGGGSPGA